MIGSLLKKQCSDNSTKEGGSDWDIVFQPISTFLEDYVVIGAFSKKSINMAV